MWKVIEAELAYNWLPLVIALFWIVVIMFVVLLAGEENWYGPSGLYGLVVVAGMAILNIVSKTEKRVFSWPLLPLKRKEIALGRMYFYSMLVILGNAIPLLIAAVISPQILTPVTMGRFFLVAGSLLAISGSYLIVIDSSRIFEGRFTKLKFFGVVGLIAAGNAIFYTFLIIEMPKRYKGILSLLGLEKHKAAILQFIYSLESGAVMILLGLTFYAIGIFTYNSRKSYLAK